jgi:hypothetical protein
MVGLSSKRLGDRALVLKGGVKMTDVDLLKIEVAFAGIMLFVNFFRFNILFVVAAICVDIAVTLNPALPKEWMMWAFYLLAFGEMICAVVKARQEKRGFIR